MGHTRGQSADGGQLFRAHHLLFHALPLGHVARKNQHPLYRAATAAGKVGLKAAAIPTLLVQGDNKPGLGHALAQAVGNLQTTP